MALDVFTGKCGCKASISGEALFLGNPQYDIRAWNNFRKGEGVLELEVLNFIVSRPLYLY